MAELLEASNWTIWVIPMQLVFPNNHAAYQDGSSPIYTAGTVQLWFVEHEAELQHLPWLTQSPYLNIIEPLLSVLETRARNRFPPATSLKQLEHFLQEECKKGNSSRDCSILV
jgi:hypothetical protein